MNIEELYALYLQNPSVKTDTRQLQTGELYFALHGENFNGNMFTSNALNQGASYCIIDDEAYNVNNRCIVVKNVLQTLQQLAMHHRKQFNIPFIAITGSNGKTTTKELVHCVLSASFRTTATIGNLNNHIGIPLTILQIPTNTEIAIIEMGANHQKEIASYCEYVLPTYGLINNCGKAHLEGFGGEEGVRKGKGELYDFIRESKGIIFRNADLNYLQSMATGIEKQITYGEYEGDYRGKPLQSGNEKKGLRVAVLNSGMEAIIESNLIGEYNFPNIMAAVAIGSHFNISINAIRLAIESYHPTNSRSQLITKDGNQIILDAYNANPTSMQLAIDNFAKIEAANKWVMLGGMMELGDASVQEHQAIVNRLIERKLTQVILVGGDFEYIQHPFCYFKNSDDARSWFKENQLENTTILIKGSRAMAMEKILH